MLFRVLENLKQRDGIITMSQEIKSDSKLAGRADILNKWSGMFPQQRWHWDCPHDDRGQEDAKPGEVGLSLNRTEERTS